MNTMPKIALGAWSWGAGAAGGDQVFGNHLFEDDLRPVFDKALECGMTLWDTAAVYGEGTSERIPRRPCRRCWTAARPASMRM